MEPGAPFRALPPDTPQEDIQRRLEEVHRTDGLVAALDGLFELQLAAGYITREKLIEVERLSFADPETGLEFRIQVNFARSKYKPPPPTSGTRDSEGSSPPCLLCKGNVGLPGKETLRIYEFPLDEQGRRFFVQLTPFPLYPHHFVLILSDHQPQSIDRRTVPDMLAFLRQAPGYTVCSNSDVEWAGSSILDHLHFQVFRDLELPVMNAPGAPHTSVRRSGCRIEMLQYPLSAFRLSASEADSVREVGSALIGRWKSLDPGRNTVNLVLARSRDRTGEYRMIVLLRNPDFRTPPALQRFKREGVGVIEASGEAILPVPEGEQAEELWREIRENGLDIVKGIIRGNSPEVPEAKMKALLENVGERMS
jgi:UDPglucose--hexose-1-phosphate uridylyltransferase